MKFVRVRKISDVVSALTLVLLSSICLASGCLLKGQENPLPLELYQSYTWDVDNDGEHDFIIDYVLLGNESGIADRAIVDIGTWGAQTSRILAERVESGANLPGRLIELKPGSEVVADTSMIWTYRGRIPTGSRTYIGLRTSSDDGSLRYGWAEIEVDLTRLRNRNPAVMLYDYAIALPGESIRVGEDRRWK